MYINNYKSYKEHNNDSGQTLVFKYQLIKLRELARKEHCVNKQQQI